MDVHPDNLAIVLAIVWIARSCDDSRLLDEQLIAADPAEAAAAVSYHRVAKLH